MADTPSGALREDVSTSSTSSNSTTDAAAEPVKKPRARRTRAAAEAPAQAAAVGDEPTTPTRRPRTRRTPKATAEAPETSGETPTVSEAATPSAAEADAADTVKSPRTKKKRAEGTAAPRATRSTRARKTTTSEGTKSEVATSVSASTESEASATSPETPAAQSEASAATEAASPETLPSQSGESEVEASTATEDEAPKAAADPQQNATGASAPAASSEKRSRPAIRDGELTEDAADSASAGLDARDGSQARGHLGDAATTSDPDREAGERDLSGEPSSDEVLARAERHVDDRPREGREGGAPDRTSRSRREEPPARRIREDGELPHDRLDEDAVKVVTRLHQFGHEAYLVGGCVRDLLLDRKPKDFDVATSATPNEVRGIFRNCRLIGRRFRLAHVYFRGGKVIEVSTFRANPTELEANGNGNGNGNGEGEEAAAEGDLLITHDNVFGTAEEDARRRDFTMNGLFYDVEEGKVIDFVHGRRDLERREIRTIGDPEVRMREDPVRILRAVRFANKLELDLESRTYAAMEGAVEDLVRCAPARLLEETFRLLRGGYAEGSLKLLNALDALRILLPPLGEALREGGREAEERCWTFARALDEVVRSGEEVEDSLLLAALLIPITGRAPVEQDAEQRQTMSSEVEALLAELVQGARLPRRIAERARHLLFAQQILSGERRRRGGQASFRRHPIYCDALRLFEMTVQATGEHREALDAWKAGSAPAPTGSEGGSRSRRQRRPRRRGGHGGNGGGSSNGGDAS